MTAADNNNDLDRRRAGARRTALILAGVALAVFAAFFARAILSG